MSSRSLTIELPDPIFEQLKHLAELTQQAPEQLAAQSIARNLPPSVDSAPVDVQVELVELQKLSLDQLLVVAYGQLPEVEQRRILELLDRHSADALSQAERQDLAQLREAADRLMLRKAYAWAVLRWRGYPIPALNDLAVA